jgi:thioester reductase-like protein
MSRGFGASLGYLLLLRLKYVSCRPLSSKAISGLSVIELGKISCIPADLSLPTLGLNEEVVSELKNNLTAVIYSAWAVNFNLGVRSFESHYIRGTYNLLNFCLVTRTV